MTGSGPRATGSRVRRGARRALARSVRVGARLRASAGGAGGTDTPRRGDLISAAIAVVFDPDYYLRTYPDIAAAGVDPLVHYLDHGRSEGRRPTVLFDPEWYVEQNPDVRGDPLEHFLDVGGQQGRDPSRYGFQARWYLDRYPEVVSAGVNPLVHYLAEGAAAGLDPSPHFSTSWYLEQNPEVARRGVNPLVHYLRTGARMGKRPNPRGTSITGAEVDGEDFVEPVHQLESELHPEVRPLRIAPGRDVARVNLVLESLRGEGLESDEFSAGVLALRFAERTGRTLRVIATREAVHTVALADLVRLAQAAPTTEIETVLAAPASECVEMGAGDVFLTTSWMSTWSVLQVVPAARVCYVAQADERGRYPNGEMTGRVMEVLANDDLKVVVGSDELRQHFLADGLRGLESRSVTMDQSVADYVAGGRVLGEDTVRKVYVHAAPEPESMWSLAVGAVDEAVRRGTLREGRFEVHLVGGDVPPVSLSDGSVPVIHSHLDRSQHRELVRSCDLAVVLVAGPWPGQAVMQAAAAGLVTVTNTWRGRTGLDRLSDRVLEVAPTLEGLADGLEAGLALLDEVGGRPFVPPDSPAFAAPPVAVEAAVDSLARWLPRA